MAEFAFDELEYQENDLALCGAFLTSEDYQRRIAGTPEEWKDVNTVFWHRGTAYALHDDLVYLADDSGGDISQADPASVRFRLCKLCHAKHGAGV